MKITVRKRTVFIFLALIGLLVYSNSFRVPFHYDDITFLKEKLIIKSLPLFLEWITEDFLRIISGRAFLLFTFYLNYVINGLDTFGYHLVNLAIHISTAFLFYLLITKYVINDKTIASNDNINPLPVQNSGVGCFLDNSYHLKAILASTVFLVHPINTESVTYISSRSSELSALFIVASMLCFFRATQNKFHFTIYVLSIFFFILGLSTKEAAVVIPLLILLFDLYFISNRNKNFRARFKYHLPFWLMILAGFSYYARFIIKPEMYDRPWLVHILTESKVFIEYLRLLILPFGLNFDHYVRESVSLDPWVLSSIMIIFALLIIAIFIRNKNRVLSFSIIWVFINLVPFMTIKLSDYMTERWLYAAAIGFSLGLVELIMRVFSGRKKIGVIVLSCIILLFGSLTVLRNNVYKSPVDLWADSLKKSPEKARPYTNLSASYLERGNIAKAIEIMELSIKMGNRAIETYLNLANAYFLKDDLNKAEEILVSLHNRGVPEIYYYNLGVVYKFKKEYEKSIEEFKKVLKTNPQSISALGSIGECYELLGEKDKAREYFMSATEGIPRNAEDYLVLAKSYFAIGENQKGTESLNKALIADPFNIYIRNIIANTLLEKNYLDEAYKHFSLMAEISPDYVNAYKGMGRAMLAKGNTSEARRQFKKALSLLPDVSPERKEIERLLTQSEN